MHSRQLKSAYTFTISNLLVRGVSILSVPIFTRVLSEEQYGLWSVYSGYLQILIIIATWDIPYGAFQKGLFKYSDEKQFSLSVLIFVTFNSLLSFFMVFGGYDLYGSVLKIPRNMLWPICVYSISYTIYRNWIVEKQKEYSYLPVFCVSVFYGFAIVLIPLFCVLYFDATANTRFGTEIITTIIITVGFSIRTISNGVHKYNISVLKKHIKFIIAFQAPCVLHSLSLIVLGISDRLMISNMVGNTQAAYYSVAYSVASCFIIVITSIDQSFTPWIYEQMKKASYERISGWCNAFAMLVAGGLLIFEIIAPEIMCLLFPKNYYEAIYSMAPVTCSLFFMMLYSSFVHIQAYFEDTTYIMRASVVGGILNIVLNVIGIPLFGYIVCGYTTLISYAVLAVAHYSFSKRLLLDRGSDVSAFDGAFLLKVSILMIGGTLLGVVCYPHPTIRYMFLFVILLVVIIRKNYLIALFYIGEHRKDNR